MVGYYEVVIDGGSGPSVNYQKDFRRFAYSDFRLEEVHTIPGELEKGDSGSKQVIGLGDDSPRFRDARKTPNPSEKTRGLSPDRR